MCWGSVRCAVAVAILVASAFAASTVALNLFTSLFMLSCKSLSCIFRSSCRIVRHFHIWLGDGRGWSIKAADNLQIKPKWNKTKEFNCLFLNNWHSSEALRLTLIRPHSMSHLWAWEYVCVIFINKSYQKFRSHLQCAFFFFLWLAHPIHRYSYHPLWRTWL